MAHASTYADAGVNISAANRAKAEIKRMARATFSRDVVAGGSFGGLFRLRGPRQPVLVSSMDGVGTKLKVAIAAGRHDTVGRDLVNHCVNDILVQGARPLFFLDYLALGQMDERLVAAVVRGVSRGCRENGCVLIGGETAEMPGFYAAGDYDLAGCIVGVAEASRVLPRGIRRGDLLLGLRSAGLHTNGYSLARRLLLEQAGYRLDERVPELGATVGEALLAQHRQYWTLLAPLVARGALRGMAHITGGGITENLPRILPAGCAAEVESAAWEWPPIFRLLQRLGNVPLDDMRRTFNLGIGMILVVAPARLPEVAARLRGRERFFALGRIVAGKREVIYR